MEQNKERQERGIRLLEAPVQQARNQDRVAERRNWEQLGGTLQQAHEQRLRPCHGNILLKLCFALPPPSMRSRHLMSPSRGSRLRKGLASSPRGLLSCRTLATRRS